MDERTLKRLLITLLVAIAIILLAKSMLTRTYTNLNKAATAKKQAVQQQQTAPVPAVAAQVIELPESAPDIGVAAIEPSASAVVEVNAR